MQLSSKLPHLTSDRKEIRIGDAACTASSVRMNIHSTRTKAHTKTGTVLSPCQVCYICDDIFPSTNEISQWLFYEIWHKIHLYSSGYSNWTSGTTSALWKSEQLHNSSLARLPQQALPRLLRLPHHHHPQGCQVWQLQVSKKHFVNWLHPKSWILRVRSAIKLS